VLSFGVRWGCIGFKVGGPRTYAEWVLLAPKCMESGVVVSTCARDLLFKAVSGVAQVQTGKSTATVRHVRPTRPSTQKVFS